MKRTLFCALCMTFSTFVGLADELDTASTNGHTFAISTNGLPACNLVVSILGDRNVSEAEQAWQLKLGQLLQTYIAKLTSVRLPIFGLAGIGTNVTIKNDIVLQTEHRKSAKECYNIGFLRTSDGKLVGPPVVSRVTLIIDANGPDCARLALSNFVEQVFGPPLSAIDDPNYKWPKKTTLVIDADKFEPIQYPPETHKPPRYLNSPNEKK